MANLKHRVKKLAQGHLAGKWLSQEMNLASVCNVFKNNRKERVQRKIPFANLLTLPVIKTQADREI